jgi:hypothetical protein
MGGHQKKSARENELRRGILFLKIGGGNIYEKSDEEVRSVEEGDQFESSHRKELEEL